MANVISFRDVFAPSFWGAWNDFINYRYTDMWFTGGRGCIDGDTLIDTPSGKVKVRDFNGGDVISFDGERECVRHADPPKRYTEEQLYRVRTHFGCEIVVTDEHRFLTIIGWTMCRDLVVGMRIPTQNEPEPYLGKDYIESVEPVKVDYYWDFNVEDTHDYIAHGFVNHNSTKSSFVTMCIVLGLERDAKEGFRRRLMGDKNWKSNMTHAIVYRKIAADLKDSVYNQFVWSIEKLGLQNEYEYKLSPLRIVKRRTQQMIYFKGLDDPMKSKSLKPPFSYYKYNFFEELDQFDGMEEVRSVRQSIMRGGHVFQSFAAFNPPETTANWANFEASQYVPTRKVYHSTYLGVPKDWLGPGFIQEAENLRNTNERAYRHEYLGEITGNGGAVFPNLVEREITDEELRRYDRLYLGLDFGFSLDPSAFTAMYYDQNHNRLIIFDEIYQTNLRNVELAEMIKAKPYVSYNYIMCDSAEPKSIADLEAYGINALPVIKTERRFGFKWLQSLDEIVVDKRRTPNVYREFSQAEYRKTVSGQFISDYPKINDHTIDSVRYGSSEIAANSGIF